MSFGAGAGSSAVSPVARRPARWRAWTRTTLVWGSARMPNQIHTRALGRGSLKGAESAITRKHNTIATRPASQSCVSGPGGLLLGLPRLLSIVISASRKTQRSAPRNPASHSRRPGIPRVGCMGEEHVVDLDA